MNVAKDMPRDADLPAPVRRFLDAAYPDGAPCVDTAALEGSGTLRRRPLPPLPFKGRIFIRPGADRVMDILVGFGPVTLLRGLDAYIDGKGFTRVAGKIDAGPNFDQGAFHTLVIETILFPAAWSRLGVAWEQVDDTTARVRVPFKDGSEIATVHFDPASGLPSAYEVPRYKGKGPKVDWLVRMSDWRRFGAIWEPGTLTARWMDEPRPWFRMRIERVAADVDVSDALRRARDALARAEGEGRIDD